MKDILIKIKELIKYLIFGSNKVKNISMKNGGTLVLNKKRHLVTRQNEFIVRSLLGSLLVFFINSKYTINLIITYMNTLQITSHFYKIFGILLFLVTLVEHTIVIVYTLQTFKSHLIGCSISKTKLACDLKYGKQIIVCNFIYFMLNYIITFIKVWSMNGLIYTFSKLVGLLAILLILIYAWIRFLNIQKEDIIRFDTVSLYSDGNKSQVDIEKDIAVVYKNLTSEVIDLTKTDLQIAEDDDILLIDETGIKRISKNRINKIKIGHYELKYVGSIKKWKQM